MRKKYFIGAGGLIVLTVLVMYFVGNTGNKDSKVEELPSVEVSEGTVVEKALATGTIEPENEIQVKSKISGVISKLFVDPGSYVEEGKPLLEIRPDPTPLELAEAKRNLEMSQIVLNNLETELRRSEQLRDRNLISAHDYESVKQRYDDAKIREQLNRERLQLLESGRVKIGDSMIESVIRAPISGFILERNVEIGDPVVPLTSYQAGTSLMTMASMEKLIFKGTVDEIDVGKIEEGMPVDIKIGALPNAEVKGVLSMISLKSRKEDNTTVFPVEITVTDAGGTTLRAGYSANADIIIERRENVLVIPERVVTYRDGKSFIEIEGTEPGSRKELEIKTGMSDAIQVEVKDGLSAGDKVLEKPVRQLKVDI